LDKIQPAGHEPEIRGRVIEGDERALERRLLRVLFRNAIERSVAGSDCGFGGGRNLVRRRLELRYANFGVVSGRLLLEFLQ
jgi:hypothetical protein